tara:strand:+ start:976 stop:1260 length:285 start_codon:yes stop_codon:yes gene_type:complete
MNMPENNCFLKSKYLAGCVGSLCTSIALSSGHFFSIFGTSQTYFSFCHTVISNSAALDEPERLALRSKNGRYLLPAEQERDEVHFRTTALPNII